MDIHTYLHTIKCWHASFKTAVTATFSSCYTCDAVVIMMHCGQRNRQGK